MLGRDVNVKVGVYEAPTDINEVNSKAVTSLKVCFI